jgi:hypothetical protein
MKIITAVIALSLAITSIAHADKGAIVIRDTPVGQNMFIKGKMKSVGIIKKGAAINVTESGYNWMELTFAPIRQNSSSPVFVDFMKKCSGKNKCYVDSADIKID